MPFAVVLYLDEPASRAIEEAQAAIVQAGLSPDTRVMNFRPHMSLAISERLDVPGFEPYLRDFASATRPLELCFASFQTFQPQPRVLYLAPADSTELLALHQRFHSGYPPFAGEPWEYYFPAQWVPHCTVANGLRDEDVAKALELCGSLRLPICARVEEVALVEFYPTRPHYSFALSAD